MVKQRKERSGGEFIGFGAFATPSQQDAASSSPAVSWAPVYMGTSPEFRGLFQRIAQKRDRTTLLKAIQDVQGLFQSTDVPKKIQAEALQHWAWLYHTKVGPTESNASVRAASFQTWVMAADRLPKAVGNLVGKYTELLGMFLLAQTDPSTEVRTIASNTAASNLLLPAHPVWPWRQGLFDYTSRILSYGRPSTMDDSLFPQQQSGGEPDREAMEERFNRLVGNCLDSLAQWVLNKGLLEEGHDASNPVWWKYLASPKPALRLKSYHLVSAVASKSPTMACDLRKRLPELVASEKDVGTIVDLLETVLAVLVHAGSDAEGDALLVKALSKLFRKGCHRAPADRWGPIILPLVVKLNKSIDVLKAVQDGIPTLLSDSDKWAAWTAVCETALLCGEHSLWKDGLEVALSKTDSHRSATRARSSCFRGLARQVATHETLDVSSFLLCPGAILTEFVDELLQVTPRRWIPELQQRGLLIIKHTGDSTPSVDDYQLLHSLVQYVGPLAIFSTEDALTAFVTGDLVRWSITHASENPLESHLISRDFELLSACSIESNVQTRCWEPFLRDLLTDQCHVVSLTKGLEILVRANGTAVDWIICDALDEHALKLGRDSVQSEGSPSEDELSSYADQLMFFRVCFGKLNQRPLLHPAAITKLVQIGSSGLRTQGSSLLEALLVSCQQNEIFVDESSLQQIVLGASRCVHCALFETHGKELLIERRRSTFITVAAHDLRESLGNIHKDRDAEVLWVERACVILDFCESCDRALPLVGFEAVERWTSDTLVMFRVLMLLFDSWGTQSSHWIFVRTWFDSAVTTRFVDFLLLLSEAGPSSSLNYKVMKRKDRCGCFLGAIGASALGSELLEELVTELSSRMSLAADNEHDLEKLLSVFSQLLHFLFLPLVVGTGLCLKAENIREGDEVTYLTDATQPDSFVSARVAKVHFDAQAGYYFTLAVMGENCDVNERQTVLGRLRRKDYSALAKTGCFRENLSTAELDMRKRVLDRIMKGVIMQHQSKIATSLTLSELLAVAVGHVGLGTSRGIGTAHYDIRRCITETEMKARSLLQDRDMTGFGTSLQALSLALGFGRVATETFTPITEIKLDPVPLTQMILNDELVRESSLNPALVSWFVVCLRLSEGDQLSEQTAFQAQCLTELFRLSSASFSGHQEQTANEYMLGSRALSQSLRSVQILNKSVDEELEASRQMSLTIFVDAYLANDEKSHRAVATLESDDVDLFVANLCESETTDILDKKADELYRALFNPTKRSHCFKMMAAVASRKQCLYDSENIRLSDCTSGNLSSWQTGLAEEEATELEEDIYIVAEWIPGSMMRELESWSECSLEDLDNKELVGRFLVWFILLDLVESATPSNFRIRPAFVSYLEKCGAVNELLNLCVVYSETVAHNTKHRYEGVPESHIDILSTDDVDKLATFSLFRAVEVFPSLSKRWWEEECPKSSVSLVQSFVEHNITLEILKRELRRMKKSTSFGAMTVSGSTVSREVVATYEQDDFNLKVVVSIPTCFPLRSAEVDCSKTLGVPQSRWKMWSLQIRLMLNNQGGTLQDALVLWKNNVDQEFEGVEPCPVCYSVLHVKTHKLPSLECTTCHNRFHFDCLTQWFRSSGKNQCVLCQQQWQGTRI